MRNLLILTMLFCFIGSMAMASETRVMTMGGVNNIVKDDANIWIYPQTIIEYPNLFTAEFPSPGGDFYKGGATFGFGEAETAWALGTYFSKTDFAHDYFVYENGQKADHRINLLYGRELGGNPFGMNFGYYKGGSENADTNTVANYEESFTRYELTFGYSPMPELELAAGFNMSSWTDTEWDGAANSGNGAVVDETKPDGNSDMFLMGRYWMAPRGNCTPVAHFAFMNSKQGMETYIGDSLAMTVNKSTMTIDLGIGMNYDGGADVLVVTDFGITFANTTYETTPGGGTMTEAKDGTTTLPYFKVGIDAKVFEWMDFRGGVTNDWEGNKVEASDVEETTMSSAETVTYLGAGFHWGDFEIDAMINQSFIQGGPYFISGDATPGMFSTVSINYWFN